jgi:hypothetical protein
MARRPTKTENWVAENKKKEEERKKERKKEK